MVRFVTILVLALIAAAPSFACGPYGSMVIAEEVWGNQLFVSDGITTNTVDVEATAITSMAFNKKGTLVVHSVDGDTTRRITYAWPN
jgi:hypothetical protein